MGLPVLGNYAESQSKLRDAGDIEPPPRGVPGAFPYVSLVPKFSNKKSGCPALGNRTAIELIEQHGEDASFHAAMQADKLMETGDMDGRAGWLRIVKAVEELLAKERPEGEKVH